MNRLHCTALAAVAAVMLAGCAGTQTSTEPMLESAGIAGDVGDPRNRAKVHTELGALYYGRGNMAVALEELRVAVAAGSSYAQAHAMFGIVYMDLRENQLAQASFQRALELSPTDPDINHNYGWFLCQSGRAADSARYFLQAVKNPLYPTPWRSYSAAGVCALRDNNFKAADDYFQRALKLEPDEPTALLQLGQLRYRQNNLEEARKLGSRLNKLLTPSAESLWLAIRVERKLGDRAAEQSHAIQLRRRFPSSAEFQAMQRGEFDK